MQLSDIIKRCSEGDRSSQNLLYRKYAHTVFPVCLRYAKNRQEAEEILQEAFLKIFKHVQQFKGTGSFEGWMRKIVVNTALSFLNAKSKLPLVVSINIHDQISNPSINQQDNLSMKELVVLIQKLPVAYRTVFNLYVFEGYKHREIGNLLNISEGTSKSNLSDARRILQNQLANVERITKTV